MRVLVCGSRDYGMEGQPNADAERARLFDELTKLAPSLIIEGGARGADWLAMTWAVENKVKRLRFNADWKKHRDRAGPIRNRQMLTEGKPDLVVAFPGGRGTADMVRRAKAAGVEVREIA